VGNKPFFEKNKNTTKKQQPTILKKHKKEKTLDIHLYAVAFYFWYFFALCVTFFLVFFSACFCVFFSF